MKRNPKDKTEDLLLKKRDQNKRTFKNSLPIFKLQSLISKKSQGTIKKRPSNHTNVPLVSKDPSLDNGPRNKRNSMNSAERRCRRE